MDRVRSVTLPLFDVGILASSLVLHPPVVERFCQGAMSMPFFCFCS